MRNNLAQQPIEISAKSANKDSSNYYDHNVALHCVVTFKLELINVSKANNASGKYKVIRQHLFQIQITQLHQSFTCYPSISSAPLNQKTPFHHLQVFTRLLLATILKTLLSNRQIVMA